MDKLSLFTLLLACATLLLAAASFWTIRQNYKFREKDRKERLLSEIIEWALNIQKSSFEIEIPEIEKLKKYGIPFSMNAYIFTIIEKSFSVLKLDYLILQDTFVGFMYLKNWVLGAATPSRAFEGEVYIKVIDAVDRELSNKENKENAARQMLKQYEHDLEKYTTLFLVKLADAKSSIV
jgi:hypothetical protein